MSVRFAALAAVYRCRLLTTPQAQTLLADLTGPRNIYEALRWLTNEGWVAHWPDHGGGQGPARRWWCTEEGRSVAEAAGDVAPRTYQITETTARAAAHLVGTNDVGIVLSGWARQYDGDQVSWEIEVPHRYSSKRSVISDSVLTYTLEAADGRFVTLWRAVEYDRGTESVWQLVEKLRSYVQAQGFSPPARPGEAHLPALEWQRRYPTWPHVLFVFGDMTAKRATHRRKYLSAAVATDPYLEQHRRRVRVWATTLDELRTLDPFRHEVFWSVPEDEPHPLHSRR